MECLQKNEQVTIKTLERFPEQLSAHYAAIPSAFKHWAPSSWEGVPSESPLAMNSDFLVKTQSCYAAICDMASPAYRLGLMESEFETGQNAAVRNGFEKIFDLFTFNQRLIEAADRGELLSWTLLFDGVFRVLTEAATHIDSKSSETIDNLGSSVLTAILACPTGRLFVGCLSELGMPRTPSIEVEPGVYRVTLERNEAEEFEHTLIKSLAHYPNGQGPDWRVVLRRISSV